MKLCIHQYAFIAAILCISTALHTKESLKIDETLQLLTDQSHMIASDLSNLMGNLKIISEQHHHAQSLDYKDPNISSSRRSHIRKLQSSAASAKNNLEIRIKSIQRLLEGTIKEINKATKSSNKNIKSSQKSATHIPEN